MCYHDDDDIQLCMNFLGYLQVCGSTIAVFIYICFLLDVMWRSITLHDVGDCVW